MERITMEKVAMIQMGEYIEFVQKVFNDLDSTVFPVDIDLFDSIMETIYVKDIDPDLAKELVEFRDRFNIDLPETTMIIFVK